MYVTQRGMGDIRKIVRNAEGGIELAFYELSIYVFILGHVGVYTAKVASNIWIAAVQPESFITMAISICSAATLCIS